MSEKREEVEVRISVTTDDNDAMVMYVSAHPEGTKPGAYIKLWVDPDAPNSYDEFEKISGVFTDDFMVESGKAMKAWIEMMVAKALPEDIERVREAVNEGMLLQGFTPERVAEIEKEAGGL